MSNLKGTRTERNLLNTFANADHAHIHHSRHVSRTRREIFEQIAAIMEDTGNKERNHAKIWFRLLGGDSAQASSGGRRTGGAGGNASVSIYKGMAADARDEGFKNIAGIFESAGA